jgi:lysophospholipase L1-like esterase
VYEPVSEMNDWIRAYCSKHKIQVVDAYVALVDYQEALAPGFDSGDGVHLNGEGYRAFGEYVASELEDRLQTGITVACLGDSLTEGYPGHFIGAESVARWKPYPAYLEREGVTVLNFGRCGDTADGLLRRFHSQVRGHVPKPDICIVHAGINDLFMDLPLKLITQNLADVYKACKRHDIEPIAVTLLPVSVNL